MIKLMHEFIIRKFFLFKKIFCCTKLHPFVQLNIILEVKFKYFMDAIKTENLAKISLFYTLSKTQKLNILLTLN